MGLASLQIAAPAEFGHRTGDLDMGHRPNEEVESEMSTTGTPKTAAEIQQDWDTNPRWKGVTRNYTAEQVSKLQGTVVEESTLARRGSEILWDLVNNEDYINSLGALTGNQAVQQVRAGLKAIYLSGWQVAGDANLAAQTYPDQSLY